MTGEMRQELNGVKTEVGALGVHVSCLTKDVGELRVQVGEVKKDVGELKVQMGEVKKDVSEIGVQMTDTRSRLDRLETITRNTAIVVTGHTETFVRMEKQLTKLDELDGLKKSLEIFTSEIIASRHARTLADKSFSDQQTMLTDHELRLTRIELRGKLS